MDFAFDVISADQHDQLVALYEPLARAVRGLIDASIHTGVDEQTIRDAQSAIESVTQTLESTRHDGYRTLRVAESGRPVAWANAVIGVRNPIAPPLTIHHNADATRCWSEFSLGAPYEGPPGRVHGGVCALVLDHLLGEVASEGLTKPRFTGTISVKYLRATPLGELRAEAGIERVEGVKTFVRGFIADAEGITAEAEGVFIEPAWARDAG